MHFIWFHRVHLAQTWTKVSESFNRQFHDWRSPRSIQQVFQRFQRMKDMNYAIPRRRRLTRYREEMYFVWYHRVDLREEWEKVRESFYQQFPSRELVKFKSILKQFYRFIKGENCPPLKEQRQLCQGVIKWTGVWYPWMREDRALQQ